MSKHGGKLMEFYRFDQNNLGKYQYSNKQAAKTLDIRLGEICRSLRKAFRMQAVLGILFAASSLIFYQQMYCAPLYLAIIWAFVWSITTLRTYFAIHNLWRLGVEKEDRKTAFRRIHKQFFIQIFYLLWFIIMVGFYCHLGMGILFTGNILIIGIVLADTAYGLAYLSCSQKNLRWWEFSDDNEDYWVLGKED